MKSSDKKNTESFVDKQKKALMLEKSDRHLKSKLISLTTHEFKNPLTVIKSSVEICSLQLETIEVGNDAYKKLRKHFSKVNNEVEKLTSLVDQALNLEKINLGLVDANLKNYQVKQQMECLLQEWIESKQILFYSKIPETLMLSFDTAMMYNVLSNLIENAIKFGGENQKPTVSIEEVEDKLTIDIKDSGIGIPAVDQPYVFQPFYRASNNDEREGFGMGLAVANKLLELQNGKLTLKSTMNKGSIFSITFPL